MKPTYLFNGPLEVGVRVLMQLASSYPTPLDLHRLVMLDYLTVHSGDFPDGPPSLHPPSPLRAGEISIRRGIIEQGLHLFASRGLVSRRIDEGGIRYVAEDLAASFLDALTSDYSEALRQRARWAVDAIGPLSDEDASILFDQTIGRWKSEFIVEQGEEEV